MNRFLKIFILFLAAFTACKKDHRSLNTDVQPGNDSLTGQFVQYPVLAFTKTCDSIATFNDAVKYLGCNTDPYLGRVDVGLYVNTSFTVPTLSFGYKAVLESAEIVLAVDNAKYAGDRTAALTFSVYALETALATNHLYFSTHPRLYDPTPLYISQPIKFSVFDNKEVIRIPVSSTYATDIMNDAAALANNGAFQAKYKGFYIIGSAASGEGIIYRVNTETETSGFYINYNYQDTAAKDTVHTKFKFGFSGAGSVKFNTMKYDYTNATPVLKSQLQGDTTSGQPLFLKGMGVSRVKIYIPQLKYYGDTFNVAVGRAEVILNLDPAFKNNLGADDITSDQKYLVPPNLSLLPVNVYGVDTFALDQLNITDNARYDGVYDKENNRYVFNISRQVQAIFKGQKANRGFHLVVADPEKSTTARRDNFIERVVLAGTSNTTLKPQFNLSYVRFKSD